MMQNASPSQDLPWTSRGISFSTLNAASSGGGGRPPELNVELNWTEWTSNWTIWTLEFSGTWLNWTKQTFQSKLEGRNWTELNWSRSRLNFELEGLKSSRTVPALAHSIPIVHPSVLCWRDQLRIIVTTLYVILPITKTTGTKHRIRPRQCWPTAPQPPRKHFPDIDVLLKDIGEVQTGGYYTGVRRMTQLVRSAITVSRFPGRNPAACEHITQGNSNAAL